MLCKLLVIRWSGDMRMSHNMTQDANTGEDLASETPSGNHQTTQPLMVEARHSDNTGLYGLSHCKQVGVEHARVLCYLVNQRLIQEWFRDRF